LKPLMLTDREIPEDRQRRRCIYYSSDDSKIPCSTVLSALPAVAPTHMMKPKRWKLGSP
jgi:hypothetical protein